MNFCMLTGVTRTSRFVSNVCARPYVHANLQERRKNEDIEKIKCPLRASKFIEYMQKFITSFIMASKNDLA